MAAQNYQLNRALDASLPDNQHLIPYEKALRNLVVLMFGHYIDVFECHSSRFGHRTILVWECFQVAQGLGQYHQFIKRGKTRDWTARLIIHKDDKRWKFSSAVTLLGDARDPTYAHPLALGQYFDQVYHQGQSPGELPTRRPGQAKEITRELYDREVAEICARLRSFDDPSFRNCKVLPPTSLPNPEIILDPAEYCKITEMKSGIAQELIHVPVTEFEADGAQGRVDIAPGVPIPTRPHDAVDDVDYASLYGVYYNNDGNRIPEYVDEIPELEDTLRGDETPASKISTDTEQAGHMDHLSLSSPYHPGALDPKDLKVQLSHSASGDTRKVQQVTPLPPKFEQLPEQINIKQLVSKVSRQITQSVVGQLTGMSPADAQMDLNIRQALATARRKEPTAKEPTATVTKPDNIQTILQATKAGGLKAQIPAPAVPARCSAPVVPV